MSGKAHSHEAHHGPATSKVYWKIALFLAVITALEVWVVYIEALRPVLALLLIVLALGKFALVAMYFMHLRFDSPLLSAFFAAGFVIAIAITLGILAQQALPSFIGPGA